MNKSFPNFAFTFRSGSFIIEKELPKEKKNLNFYHIPKPIFYFSNLEFNKKNYVDTTWRQRNHCGKIVNPADILKVRKEIMAFDSYFFLCFQNGQKPMITLSYHLDLLLLQLRLSPTSCLSHPSLETSLPLCACLLEGRVLGYNICLTSLRTLQGICPESC